MGVEDVLFSWIINFLNSSELPWINRVKTGT